MLDAAPAPPEAAPDAVRGRHRRPAPRLLAALPLVLVLLGVQARVLQWLGGRSLWMDEALLARSLVARGHVELLTEPLLHNQTAPLLWLQAVRLAVDLAGDGERALRLVSLLSGLAALGLALVLARRLLPPSVVPVAVGLVALHPELVYFSNEVKPYATDVAVTLALVLVALARRPLLLGLAGAVAVWLAYPAVFVLAGTSLVLVLRSPTWPDRARTAVRLSPWAVSFAASYLLVLAAQREREVYGDFWAYAFPASPADVPAWLVERAVDLVRDPLDLALPLLALALLGLGAVRLLRRPAGRRADAPLLLAAVPVALLAGAVGAYPLADRLALWLVPPGALVLAAAVDGSRSRGRLVLPAAAALVAVAGPALAGGAALAVQVRPGEELRPVLEQVAAQRRAGDLVLVDIAAKAAFDHYGPRLGVPRHGVVLFLPPPPGTDCRRDAAALRAGGFAGGRVWLVFSHHLVQRRELGTREDLLSRVGTVTGLVRRVRAPGAEALLLHPSGADLPPAPATPDRCLVVVRAGR